MLEITFSILSCLLAFSVIQNNANSGDDFLVSASSVYFPPGSSSENVYINIYEDTKDETTEYFDLILTSATNDVQISQSSVTVSIVDNDEPPEPEGKIGDCILHLLGKH